ncbi:MAG: Gfo/Idh/MocA family protein, partial [Candidatus Hydrothermarchaeaceae archaeon]
MSLKVILVGFGNIAEQGHLPVYREQDIEIAAVVDICAKRRQRAAVYGLDAYEKLEDVDVKADFIDLCTPPNYRLEALEYACEHDLDVICEKPLSHTGDIPRLKEILDNNSVFLSPVHNWKYAPHYREIKELVRDNGILEVEMNTLRDGYNHGNPDWDPDWRVRREISGGGILMDHGYHNIYLAMYLLGKDFKEARLKDIEFFPNSGVEKKASFELFFPERVVVNLDWYAGRREVRNTIYSDGSVIQLLDDKIIVDGNEQRLNG